METRLNDNEILCANVEPGDMVWVKTHMFTGTECWGFVQSLYPHGLHVSLDVPVEHPGVREAMAETGMTHDELELVGIIPFKDVEFIRTLSGPDQPVRVWKRPLTSSERAQRHRARGGKRVTLPELDAGLRR